MVKNTYEENRQLPSSYKNLVIEKSNLLLQANMHELQQQFKDASNLFAKSAEIEAQLAETVQEHGRPDLAAVHLVSEMSCWAAAGDTYRALTQGQKMLALSFLTPEQQTHVRDFIEQLEERRQAWMASWRHHQAMATA
ncbi:MAG: hypothetical protein AAF639_16895 [Chloroflexota bacterium]